MTYFWLGVLVTLAAEVLASIVWLWWFTRPQDATPEVTKALAERVRARMAERGCPDRPMPIRWARPVRENPVARFQEDDR